MKRKIFMILIILILIVISFSYTIKYLDNVELNIDKETLDILIEESENTSVKRKLISKLINIVRDKDLINPVSIVASNYRTNNSEKVSNIEPKIEKIEIKKPIVYIYNTHEKELYQSPKEININYSVQDASFYLQKKLKQYNIESIVETKSISDILSTNNWNYASSYRVSRMFLEEAKKNNPTLEYYIDIHRDSVTKNKSTIEINNKKYAKVMLLLGLENEDYKNNEKNIIKLEEWLETNYKGLSRGIYRKKGKGVNGIYNQDFSSNCFLIEVGGEENTFEEVENTIDVIAEMLDSYIGEEYD